MGDDIMSEPQWATCPICNNKTRIKICRDTVLEKFPLFCPKCKKETLIDAKQMDILVKKELDV